MLLNEDGAVFKTATEWLQWRDHMAWMIYSRPDLHAEVMGPFMRMLPLDHRIDMAEAIAGKLFEAEIVVWEEDKWKAATNGAEAWVGVQSPDVPVGAPTQIWTLPTDNRPTKNQKAFLELEDGYDLTAVLFMPVKKVEEQELARWYLENSLLPGDWDGQRGWTMTLIYAPDMRLLTSMNSREIEKNPLIIAYRLRPVPALDSGNPIPRHYAEFFAAQQFMSMEFVELEGVETTRQQRRAYERRNPENSSSVQIVTLRRVKRDRQEGGEPTAQAVEHHYQWMVRGHWRRRNERWKSSDAPIWVRPHVKGPDGLPLLPVKERIINVRR